MGETTKIEWADATFNPWIGCEKVSPACDFCYAAEMANRWWSSEGLWAGKHRRTSVHNWNEPVRWERAAAKAGVRRRVFCASLADVFETPSDHDEYAALNVWRGDLWRLVEATANLDWLLLTKRVAQVDMLVPGEWVGRTIEAPFPDPAVARWPVNVWIGTTVENQRQAQLRIPHLVALPAPVRFVSCEPLLGPLDLDDWLDDLDWIIAGGESGPGARPSDPAWFRALRDQCADREDWDPNWCGDPDHCDPKIFSPVPFLFKQWGDWSDGARVGKKLAGRVLDGHTHDDLPTPTPRSPR